MLLIDLSLTDTADTIDQSLTDRAKRQVRLICVCFLDPGQVVTIKNVEENRQGGMFSWLIGNGLLVKENDITIAMHFNFFLRLSVICVQKSMTQWRREKCWQALLLFVPDVQFGKENCILSEKDQLAQQIKE